MPISVVRHKYQNKACFCLEDGKIILEHILYCHAAGSKQLDVVYHRTSSFSTGDMSPHRFELYGKSR